MSHIKYSDAQKFRALQMLAAGAGITYVSLKFQCSERTLWRWKARFDGTKESLKNKSSRPHSKHPNAHTDQEVSAIVQELANNPGISLNELWGVLRVDFGYSRNIASLWKFLKKTGYYDQGKREEYVPQEYHTPVNIGEKWQMDVKFVPSNCRVGKAYRNKYFQYTMIDEASRERFIFAYDELSANATVDFVRRAILAFGYKPKMIQTDNGREFTPVYSKNKELMTHAFDRLCERLKIEHRLIRAYTPRHNGKVERSHRNDQQRFYNHMKFNSLDDLRNQMSDYLKRSNNIPSSALRFIRNGRSILLTPNQRREELMTEMFEKIKTQRKKLNAI